MLPHHFHDVTMFLPHIMTVIAIVCLAGLSMWGTLDD